MDGYVKKKETELIEKQQNKNKNLTSQSKIFFYFLSCMLNAHSYCSLARDMFTRITFLPVVNRRVLTEGNKQYITQAIEEGGSNKVEGRFVTISKEGNFCFWNTNFTLNKATSVSVPVDEKKRSLIIFSLYICFLNYIYICFLNYIYICFLNYIYICFLNYIYICFLNYIYICFLNYIYICFLNYIYICFLNYIYICFLNYMMCILWDIAHRFSYYNIVSSITPSLMLGGCHGWQTWWYFRMPARYWSLWLTTC